MESTGEKLQDFSYDLYPIYEYYRYALLKEACYDEVKMQYYGSHVVEQYYVHMKFMYTH